MRSERFYPAGPDFDSSAGKEVEIRMGGRRAAFVIKFDKPVDWMAFGVRELRRFHAVLGRKLREFEGMQPVEHPPEPAEEPEA
jgi:hypothetical protein